MTLIQALLIALVAALGQAAGDIGGNVMVNRPIVLAPIRSAAQRRRMPTWVQYWERLLP